MSESTMMRTQGKDDPCLLLVGVESCTATMENSVEVPPEAAN